MGRRGTYLLKENPSPPQSLLGQSVQHKADMFAWAWFQFGGREVDFNTLTDTVMSTISALHALKSKTAAKNEGLEFKFRIRGTLKQGWDRVHRYDSINFQKKSKTFFFFLFFFFFLVLVSSCVLKKIYKFVSTAIQRLSCTFYLTNFVLNLQKRLRHLQRQTRRELNV